MNSATNETIVISKLMETSGVKFGTSGARGLADDMTDRVCYAYSLAFLDYLLETADIKAGDRVAIAGDYRPSTPRIMAAVAKAVSDAGCEPLNCGYIPTPAVACYAMASNLASIMVTGSHIPDDRNGIKFYKPEGEILKGDEEAMCARKVTIRTADFDTDGNALIAPLPAIQPDAYRAYVKRYLDFFPAGCLQGLKIGIYEHSSVDRDILSEVVGGLGAEVVHLGRSDKFIPVDTEAIRPEDVSLALKWSREHKLDCIVSTDGDGDRPLVSDEHGEWLRGDVAGILTARYLAATHVVTPVSSNSAVEKCGWFDQVDRTRIGSPFVIAAMDEAVAGGSENVIGYEANGGFLTASDIDLNGKNLTALPTRDAVIVPLAILMLAKASNLSISGLLKQLPQRFTSSDRLKNFPTELSREKLRPLSGSDQQQNMREAQALLGAEFGEVISIDNTDGVRITFASGEVVHLRPSGNAPELRCYNEADSDERAVEMNKTCLAILESWRH
ncbi:phosphomannomutase [Mariprofundus ferrinatatus]|uniref:Phosphomannomutase n=1 Tax=Mariprofundus ferrinatatus TaxID=1921087 RepID=A0A2K8L3L4_9PROT|nr:phosphomannomutase [Mariprofundus ferrinatatus]ATX81692.1 phosphomannomutase [Mariprofundus ferrinatatus]